MNSENGNVITIICSEHLFFNRTKIALKYNKKENPANSRTPYATFTGGNMRIYIWKILEMSVYLSKFSTHYFRRIMH